MARHTVSNCQRERPTRDLCELAHFKWIEGGPFADAWKVAVSQYLNGCIPDSHSAMAKVLGTSKTMQKFSVDWPQLSRYHDAR